MPNPQFSEENKKSVQKPPQTEPVHPVKQAPKNPIRGLQQQVGNQAVQRLLAQRAGEGAFDLDEDTAGRINRARGGGQPLDGVTGKKMGSAMGTDFGDVQVHTGKESDELNQQVGAEAFTTGKDIFFREGAYNPGASGGQELIAHELTHVVQQGQGMVAGGGGNMTVNEPGDVHEQQADSVARSVTNPGSGVQRQDEETTSSLQRQEIFEEEELQMQPIEEEEELLQMQPIEEEEELLQPQPIEEEEEELQMQPIEEEEEEMQP